MPGPADSSAPRTWTNSTFLDRVDGALSDGGANTYVAADGSVRLINLTDLNRDGYRDIRFANHVKDGDHRVNAFIYWGGAAGFSVDRRLELPAPGNHFLSGVDIGNVYDRSDRYDYVSPPFAAPSGSRFETLAWNGETPFRTGLELQIRSAATREAPVAAPWTGPDGPGSHFGKPGSLPAAVANVPWIQYKATLISPNDANTPVLRSVTVTYR